MTEPSSASGVGADRSDASDRRWWGRPDILIPVAVVLAHGFLAILQLGRSWSPDGDWAIAELIIRHLDRHLPLSGAYSADRGYDHPLPLVYLLQVPLYLVSGRRSSAGLTTTVLFNGVVLAGACWLLVRARATEMAVLLVAGVSLFAAHAATGTFLLPWNPNLGVVPALAFLVAAWRVALGSRRLLPVAAGLGVWAGGAHLGFVPMVIAVAAVSTFLLLRHEHRRGRGWFPRELRMPIVLSIAVVFVLTTPMLLDVVLNGSSSNPAMILRGGSGGGDVRTPTGDMLSVTLDQFRIPPSWASGSSSHSTMLHGSRFPIPWFLIVVVGVVVAARRRRAFGEITAMVLGAVAMLSAIGALAVIDDPHIVHWYLLPTHAASIGFWVFVLSSGVRSLLGVFRPREHSSPVVVPVLAAVTLVAALLLGPSLRTEPHTARIASVTARMTDAAVHELPAGSTVLLSGPTRFEGYATAALTLALDRAGLDVRVPEEDEHLFSPAMTMPRDRVDETLELRLRRLEDLEGTAPVVGEVVEGSRLLAVEELDHPLIGEVLAELWLG